MNNDKPAEGRRARKRAETRARILATARDLFLAKGYDATTIDEIADLADISKRSFFDYFPGKEDVVAAWQDAFGDLLVAKVAIRPPDECLGLTVRKAMSEAISESVSPEGIEMDTLVRKTASLRARMHLKYARLEARLAEALKRRAPPPAGQNGTLVNDPDLLAMIAVGVLRLGSEAWLTSGSHSRPDLYVDQVFGETWRSLAGLVEGME